MHSTLLRSSPTKHTFVSEHHGPLQPLSLRDMEAKQHQIKSLKSYPETGGRSLAAAAGGDGGGGYRAGSAEMEMDSKIQKAIEFKAEGHRCYKEKKFREAIGKYHRALLQLKGVHVVDGTTGSEVNLLSQAAAKLTEEQRRAVESTEIECYDSLTGDTTTNTLKLRNTQTPTILQVVLTPLLVPVAGSHKLRGAVVSPGAGISRGGRNNTGAEMEHGWCLFVRFLIAHTKVAARCLTIGAFIYSGEVICQPEKFHRVG